MGNKTSTLTTTAASIKLGGAVSESDASVLFLAHINESVPLFVRRFKRATDSKSSELARSHRAAAARTLRDDAQKLVHLHLLLPIREARFPASTDFDEPSLVLPHCNCGTLSSTVAKRVDEKGAAHFADEELLNLALQLASGLSALHAAGFAHGNLSLRNILVDAAGTSRDPRRAFEQWVLKIDDFRSWPDSQLKVCLKSCAPFNSCLLDQGAQTRDIQRWASVTVQLALLRELRPGEDPLWHLRNGPALANRYFALTGLISLLDRALADKLSAAQAHSELNERKDCICILCGEKTIGPPPDASARWVCGYCGERQFSQSCEPPVRRFLALSGSDCSAPRPSAPCGWSS